MRTVEEIKQNVIDQLADKYELVCIDYDDQLMDEQIVLLLAGDNPFDSKAFADFDEWVDDCCYDAALSVIGDLCEDGEYEILKRDSDALDGIRLTIRERDVSDPFGDLLKATGDRLFRYDLGYDLADGSWAWADEEYEVAALEIAEAAGLNPDNGDLLRELWSLVAESTDGGRLYVLWSGDVAQAVDLASAVEGTPEHDNPGTVTFVEPHLLVLNSWNGSGSEVRVEGNVTLPIVPRRVQLDAAKIGGGYSWTDVAGPVTSAYGCDVTIVRPTGE